jgi:hypothetical protein
MLPCAASRIADSRFIASNRSSNPAAGFMGLLFLSIYAPEIPRTAYKLFNIAKMADKD